MRNFSKEQLKGPLLPPSIRPAGRQRMLEMALRLFAQKGFHGSSTRDLTTALEVQPSALYAHFASKEDVLVELIEIGYDAHHQALRNSVLEAGEAPADQLSALVRANARFHAKYALLAVVVHEEVHAVPEERMKVSNVFRQQAVSLLMQVVERGVTAKVFDPPHLLTTVAALGAMAVRIPYWFGEDNGLTVDALADAQAALALRMVGATE